MLSVLMYSVSSQLKACRLCVCVCVVCKGRGLELVINQSCLSTPPPLSFSLSDCMGMREGFNYVFFYSND